ncbi:MAG: hypothetical protein Q9220_000619 [cf. Caloplaca sp. 1 TL-2023]
MAPLAERSVNRPGKAKNASLKDSGITPGKAQTPRLPVESDQSSLPAVSAIQSMLKNTTELGDAAQFRAKPIKTIRQHAVPHARPRPYQHGQPRHAYVDHADGSHHRRNQYPPMHHGRHGQFPRYKQILMANGQQAFVLNSHDHRLGPLNQPPSNSRRISIQSALPMIRPYGLSGPRPRSPYAYQSRPRHAGYPPWSPPYSDINKSDSALHTGVHGPYSVRTISPMSTSSVLNQGFNRSDPSFGYRQAALFSRRHDGNRSPPYLRGVPLRSSPLASHRSSMTQKSRLFKSSGSNSPSETTSSQAPLFYDYSEPFECESFQHTAQRSSLFMARQVPQSDGSSEGYQTDVTNTSNTFAQYSTSSSESKPITPERSNTAEKRPSPLRFLSRVLKQTSAEHNKARVGTMSDFKESDKPITKECAQATTPSQPQAKTPPSGNMSSSKETTLDRLQPTENMLRYPPSTYNPAPKVMKSAIETLRLSSSSSGSQYSTSAHSRQDQSPGKSVVQAPSMAYEWQPKSLSVSLNRVETMHEGTEVTEPQQRAASLDARLRPEPCEILAPLPARSVSSRGSRDRFSRILSMGEDLDKRGIFAYSVPNKKAPMTIQQYLRDKKTHSPSDKSSTTKELPPLPVDARRVLDKGKGREVDEPNYSSKLSGVRREALNNDALPLIGLERLIMLHGLEQPGIPKRYSSVSRNSQLDMPGPSESERGSIQSPKPGAEDQARRIALMSRNSSLFQAITKELPSLPTDKMVVLPPPECLSPLELPCSFTPLMAEERLDTAVANIEDTPAPEPEVKQENIRKDQQTPTRGMILKSHAEGSANASPASTRPWNLDASYPWTGTPPKLEVGIPTVIENTGAKIEDAPRFKFRLYRSSFLGTGGKLTKNRPPNIELMLSSAADAQVSSAQSHLPDSTGNAYSKAPNIALMPLSPGFHIEAQSFFSDDSSLKRRKGSLRKRLSQIRGMAIRTTSSEDIHGSDRGTATSALGGLLSRKGSSKQNSTNSADISPSKSSKWRMFDKIKLWFHRNEHRMKRLRHNFARKSHHRHVLSVSS